MATTLGNGVVDYNTAALDAKKKMIANQAQINKDPNYVASEQQRALQVIAQRQSQGMDTSGQQKYLTQQLGYKAPTPVGAASGAAYGMNGAGATQPKPNTTTATTTAAKSNAQQGSDYMSQMAAIAQRQSTPFSYDPNSDPAYQAALTRAKANIDAGNSQAQAEMNRRGILNSTITSDRMGEIASQEMGNVETTVIPQLMQQAYQKYIDSQNQQQQQFSNLGTVANAYLGEDQRGIDNTNTRANMTGYLPGGEDAQKLYTQLMGLKQQAEAKGITAAERNKLSNQATGIRAMLSQMGVDITNLGANTNYNTASQVAPAIRTLQGQQVDQQAVQQQWDNRFNYGQAVGQFANGQQTLASKAQNFNQGFATRQQNFTEGQQNWNNQFDLAKFTEDTRRYGLDYALQEQQVAISQQNADSSSAGNTASIANSQFGQLMDVWQATGKAPAGLESYGVNPGEVYSAGAAAKAAAPKTFEDYQSNVDKIVQRDKKGIITNPQTVEDYIINSDLSPYEMYRAYGVYGLKWDGEVPKPGE